MSRKDGSPPNSMSVKPDGLHDDAGKSHPQYTPNTNGSATPSDQRNGTPNGNANYYDQNVNNSSTTYPPLGYSDQSAAAPLPGQNGNGNAPVAGSYDLGETAQYLYSNASGTAAPPSASEQESASTQNPLVAFASQAAQHVSNQSAEDWRPQAQAQAQLMVAAAQGGNPWHDWTAAIADSQERYSANALLTLGGGRQEDIGHGAVSGEADMSGLGVGGTGTSHSGQWPLLLFHDGPGGATSGS